MTDTLVERRRETAPAQVHGISSYRTYWVAWLVLLGLTLVMVSFQAPAVLLVGIVVKAAIIALFFMHLRHEKLDLSLLVIVSVLFCGLLLFGLIAPDGMAM